MGTNSFRFENLWLLHPAFIDGFTSWWRVFRSDGWDGQFMRKLHFVKSKLKEWNKESFGELKKSILNHITSFDAIEQGNFSL